MLFPKFNKSRFGFKYIAPTIWNKLSLNICCTKTFSAFKKVLKTHYFTLAFENDRRALNYIVLV